MTTKTTERKIAPLIGGIERFSIAKQPSREYARQIFEGANELAKKYEHLPQAYWTFNEETGEINGSYLHRLILVNEFLAQSGKRTLTFEEGMELDKQGLLTNGVYRDFGLALYDAENPNSITATALVKEAKKRGLELPVLAHPLSLKLDKTGIEVLFGDNDALIMSGEEAVKALRKFNYKGNSDVQWLSRDRGGDWYASWDGLSYSFEYGRVAWIRAEVARADLEADAIQVIEKAYQNQAQETMADLEKRKQQALELFRKK